MLFWIVFIILALAFAAVALLWFWLTQPLFSFSSPLERKNFSPENLKSHVRFLSENLRQQNETRAQNLNRKADYIKTELEKTGAKISEQTFQVDGEIYRNIIAHFGDENGERIVVGAHYDTAGGLPGADDNSSGVAGLLALANLLRNVKKIHNVELVAYTLEEPPFFATDQMGSFFHAKSLRERDAKIKLMICLEMIGYFSDEPHSQRFPVSQLSLLYPSTGNFITIVGNLGNGSTTRKVKSSMRAVSDVPVYSINAPDSIPGVDFSDHRNYWQFGFDAVMVTDTAFYRNPNYHTTEDTWEKLDYDRMSKVMEGVYAAISSF